MLILGYLLAYPVVLLLSWLLLIALHEIGHALAALALAPGVVLVHLGSHGQPDGNWQVRLGRLHLFGKRNLLKWRGGCCAYQQPVTMARWRQAVFVLAGPLLPLLVAGTAFYLSFHVENGSHRLLALVFFFVAVVSTLRNLLPGASAVRLAGGQLVGTDGTQLRQLFFPSAAARLAERAASSFAAGNYAESAELHVALLRQTTPTRPLLCMAIHVLFQAGRYAEALTLSSQHHRDFASEITADDQFSHALLLSRTNQHLAANALYSALIDHPQPYPMAYVNRGYTHNILGKYELALADFDQAVLLNIEVPYVQANRGLALLKLGQTAAGLAAITDSLTLEPTQAYALRNLGIYHLDRGEYAQATTFFEQAGQSDPNTHALDTYKQQARQHLEAAL
ncbi:MAG: M50 family metallopeptidase [Janthinobacterium lividum]